MRNVRWIGICLCAALLIGATPSRVLATSLEEQQKQIEQQQNENKAEQSQAELDRQKAQEKVDDLQDEANELGYTYNSLNSQLQSITGEIESTKSEIASATADIAQLEEELENAMKKQEDQYEDMKKRIQFMYENSTASMFVSLLESGSIAEFIRRAEYIAMIVNYDRQMVEAYSQLQETIVAKSEELGVKKEQLSAYNSTLAQKQDELDDLVGSASEAYSAKQGEVSAAQMSVEEYNKKIQELRDQEAAYEQQYAQIQAELAKQYTDQMGDTTEDTSGAVSYTDADLKLMAAIIQAEAGGESYAGQLAVGSVIMNRVKSSQFPNTLSGVIYQTNQFQPVRDGHLALILERGPNESCTNAAKQVLGGYRSGNWLFFMTQKWADYFGITGYTMIGNHAFFRVWGANIQETTEETTTEETETQETETEETAASEETEDASAENTDQSQ